MIMRSIITIVSPISLPISYAVAIAIRNIWWYVPLSSSTNVNQTDNNLGSTTREVMKMLSRSGPMSVCHSLAFFPGTPQSQWYVVGIEMF
jgi:hypothetical protein